MDLTKIEFQDELLRRAKAYCREHNMTLGALGKRLVNDRRFFTQMERNERGCTIETFQRLIRELATGTFIASPKSSLNNINPLNTELRNAK